VQAEAVDDEVVGAWLRPELEDVRDREAIASPRSRANCSASSIATGETSTAWTSKPRSAR
jgi:hypothetical protein